MVDTTVADGSYLADWPGDLNAGDNASVRRPVTSVSLFAARAYCASRHKRLPTVDEWEYAAAASETQRDATGDRSFLQRLLSLYQGGGPQFKNVYGVSGLHGGPWEWTADVEPRTGDKHGHGTLPVVSHDANCAGAAIGASDVANYPAFLRDAVRASLTPRSATRSLGFRCAT